MSKFVFDSRQVEDGDIFVAIKGERNNGHDFVNEAFKKGAVKAIVEEERDYNGEVLLVDNVIDFLNREASKILVDNSKIRIGITGSNGKTTTKNFLAHLLAYGFKVFKTEKNYNTEIGIPLSILNNYSGEPVSIVEMGLRKEDDIGFLTRLYKPNVSILLNIGTAHLQFFEKREKIASEKLKIVFEMEKPGIVFVNGDEELLNIDYPEDVKVFRFGENENNDGVLIDFDYLNGNTRVFYNIYNEDVMLTLQGIWSKGQLIDALAALLVSLYFEIPLDPFYIFSFKLPEKRFELKEYNGKIVINDAYNASKESFFSAFESIEKMDVDRKILIMGRVLEITDEIEYHMEIINEAKKVFDKIYFYDPEEFFDFEGIEYLRNSDDVLNVLNMESGLIYVKASNGTGLGAIVEKILNKKNNKQ
ncbi:hypothetical protein XO10_06015 [Marinitoga sp. 1135]|uniref:UDP-N-acetylmuramoyl-tripeptide--D-alanyl-D- alanine ligase n=1 Tax=Marinitoga sp. 1135 TaxID=1643333 RepID=UPI001586B806|nr:UDP-N-acetylmuramoyl-tripeptide--D-alanyl-D-alanine ligase [Marinitoga sp. 1135]NUU95833.1 hypothetical protein [Marinitoga sp. 1135]